MAGSEAEERSRAKKRARTAGKTAAEPACARKKDEKKARGRPRVDTRDATAADRRRTQIRLAQRAYRQRKETTISSLKQQSSHLQSIIEQMHSTFVKFHESALTSPSAQLDGKIALELRQANETFSTLVKTATELDGGDDDQSDGGLEHAAETPLPQQTQEQDHDQSPPSEKLESAPWDQEPLPTTTTTAHLPQTAPQMAAHVDDFLDTSAGYQQRDCTSIMCRQPFTVAGMAQQHPMHTKQHPDLPFGLVDMPAHYQQQHYPPHDPHIHQVDIPTPSITPPMSRLPTPPSRYANPFTTKTPAPIMTYSHQERTFARRLHRLALEAGFRLVSAAQHLPAAVNHVFKLSLPYMTPHQICDRFRIMLSRDASQHLDFWETPFIHLGGAGTHYPRKDAHGNIVGRKNAWTIRQIGPLEKHMIRLQNVDDGRWEDINGVDMSGLSGEWFDAYDIQGYIEERWACRLDPTSPYTQCIVDAEDDANDENNEHEQCVAGTEGEVFASSSAAHALPVHSYTHFSQEPGAYYSLDDVQRSPPAWTNASSIASSTQPITPPALQTYSLTGSPFATVNLSSAHPAYFSSSSSSSNIPVLPTTSVSMSTPMTTIPTMTTMTTSTMTHDEFSTLADMPLPFDQQQQQQQQQQQHAPSILSFSPTFDYDFSGGATKFHGHSQLSADPPMMNVMAQSMGAPPPPPPRRRSSTRSTMPSTRRTKRVAWLDTNKLVGGLMKDVVCLGRAPGFSRSTVDEAVKEALVPAMGAADC